MAESIVDANVLIALLRGNERLRTFLETLDAAVDTTIYVEVIQGAKNKTEVALIEKTLKTFPLIHFDESISLRTIDLIRNYSMSHGLYLADAIIAATCLEKKLTLVTLNSKDFRFIKDLKVRLPKL
jgi:predicted nucleic acid-binding protein